MRKSSVALLIPAHNEEVVLKKTIRGARKAGIPYKHMYVVSNGCVDNTYEIAQSLLHGNVLDIPECIGKGNAIKAGLIGFNLTEKYMWVAITDADTILDKHFKKGLRAAIKQHRGKKVGAICGQVKTLKSRWISHYRAFQYAIGQDLYKRVESVLDLILVMPGCCTAYNSRMLKEVLDDGKFINDTLIEDYDLTLQFHKEYNWKLVYDSRIVVWTQEPLQMSAYVKQLLRWYRGWFQVAKKRVRFPFDVIDLMIFFFTLDPIIFAIELCLLVPLALITKDSALLATIFLSDLIILFGLSLYASVAKKRYEILGIFPLIYFMRFVDVPLFLKSGFDVMILRRFPLKTTAWDSPVRYEITT